jgi:hypothetical protein
MHTAINIDDGLLTKATQLADPLDRSASYSFERQGI